MKYKPLSDAHSLSMRSNYLKNKYCPNELISSKNFVEQIKTAYYKYDAPLYQPGYNQSLKTQFDSFFHNLREDKIIVDIGAGTGDSYWLVKNSSYSFSKYYFIKPFKSMIDKFEDKDNSKVVIVNDYFESAKCTEMIRKEKKPIIFIMCAVLRTIDNIDEFIDILKMNLKYGDQIFLPVEPNNEYFGKYYKYLTTIIKPLIISRLVLKKAKDLIIRNYSSAKNSEKIDEKSPLVNALDHLKKTRIVNDEFTVTMLYAIVYYNNYFCWISIDIPDKDNEGFFTIDQIAERLECEINNYNTRTYLYGISFGLPKLDSFVENILKKVFPKKGSTFTASMTRVRPK